MNDSTFTIQYDWQNYPDCIPELGCTSARVKLSIGNWNATDNINRDSRTISESVYFSLYPYALWVARSWWRLLHETARPASPSAQEPLWRLAHDLTSAGEGFVWPDLEYISDGVSMQITSYSTAYSKAAIDYLNTFSTCIPLAVFEQAHRQLIENVCERLNEYALTDTDLHQSWAAITSEYKDNQLKRRRVLEAGLGFDPDEAEPETLEMLLDKERIIGAGSLAELASNCRRGAISSLWEDCLAFERRLDNGMEGKFFLPRMSESLSRRQELPPWEIGYSLAKTVRDAANLSPSIVQDEQLGDLLGLRAIVFSENSDERGVALARRDENGNARFSFPRGPKVGRRFNAARIIADALLADRDSWLTATSAATHRQKIQRAFAGELLCPIDALRSFIGGQEPDADIIEEAAEYFRVSPFVPALQLHNKGLLPHTLREAFGWEEQNVVRRRVRNAAK